MNNTPGDEARNAVDPATRKVPPGLTAALADTLSNLIDGISDLRLTSLRPRSLRPRSLGSSRGRVTHDPVIDRQIVVDCENDERTIP